MCCQNAAQTSGRNQGMMIGHANHDASLPDMMSAHLSDYSWHSNCGACNTCDNLIRPGVWTAASSAYEPDFITAAPQKSQSNVTNMSLVICVMAKLVDRQERQQGSNCCRPRQATPHGTLSQTSHDSAAASHVSQIRAVDTTASDQTLQAQGSCQIGMGTQRISFWHLAMLANTVCYCMG